MSPWLSMLLLARLLDARGLASDFQPGDGETEDKISPTDGARKLSDDRSGSNSETNSMNFIFQFMLGNVNSNFEEDALVDVNDSKTNEFEENKQDQLVLTSNIEVENDITRPSEGGDNERRNKIYWTDEEIETFDGKQANNNVTHPFQLQEDVSMKFVELSRAGRLESLPRDRHPMASVSEPSKDTIEYKDTTNESPAQDRQLVVTFSDLSQDSIEDMFQQIVFTLPNMIDQTREVIVEDIATENMLGYTLALSYFVGAFFDTIGELLISERFLTDVISDKEFVALQGWLWFYAIGFAGPWLFPSTFSGGDPNLACSSVDYFSTLAESDLSLNIATITSRSQGEMAVLTARLSRDFNSKLGCIVHKKGKYKQAAQVSSEFEKMLGLINFYHLLSSPVPVEADLLVIDQELGNLWVQIPLLVEEAHAAVTARRAYTAAVYVFVGFFNLLGAISGVLLRIAPINLGNVPEVGVIPGAIVENAQQLLANGRFSNDFFLGETALALGQNGWGYGYYMTYFYFLEEADPGCGLVDLDDVYSRYQQLSSVEVMLSTGRARKPVVRHIVGEWRRELEVALHCLLTQEEGNLLRDTLDMFVTLANTRLDIT